MLQRYQWEWAILEWLHRISNEFLTYLFYIITKFGGEIILIGIVAFIYLCVDKKKGERIGFIAITSMLLNNSIKSLVKAPRPFQHPGREHLLTKIGEEGVNASGTSFPSGHSQNASTLYTSVALYLKKKWIYVIAITIIILVPLSRLYLGVHFPVDVIVGIILGLASAFGLYYLMRFWDKKGYPMHYLYMISLVIFLPFLFLHNDSDLFKGYGLLFGFVVGTWIEHLFVNFTNDVPYWKRLIRIVIALCGTLLIKEGLKVILPGQNWAHTIRYFFISFFAIGVLPFAFKREKFPNGI